MNFSIPAHTARAMFPKLIGPVLGAQVHVDGVCFVNMGPGSIAVMADDQLKGICPNDRKAIALAMRVAHERRR